MGEKNYHTPITGTPNIRTAINDVLSDLYSALDGAGQFKGAVIGHEVASGSASNTVEDTWTKRTLSGLEVDPDALVSISSDEFTPVAGKFFLLCMATVKGGGHNRLRLYNRGQSSMVQLGMNFYQPFSVNRNMPLFAVFTADGSDSYSIDHQASSNSSGGMGLESPQWTDEHYMQAMLVRIG